LAASNVVQKVSKKTPVVRGCGPANEGYMLIEAGIPTICGFGYVGGSPHAPDEWVQVESLMETVEMYKELLMDYCKL
jgi:acetylornithine deacetylase/succinyl-diaminopimelate desuccinylase-like protein